MIQTIRRHPYAFLLLFSAYLYLIGNPLLSVTDTAEANYALTAKEMVLSGDWMSPQIYGRYWYDKPIFYYWELAASFAVFGFNEWAARLPSAVLGCGNVLFTFWCARRVYGERTAWSAAVILGTALEFWLLSKAVITDASLFLFMSASVAFFYLGYTEDRRYYWLCWLAAALAVLTKGPIGVLLPGFSCLLFLLWKRDLGEMRHVHFFSGLLLFLLIGGSWYYGMYRLHGSDFLVNFFGVHNFLRATVPEHARQNVWYFYLMMFFAGFAPWSFAFPVSLYRRWKRRHALPPLADADRFFLVWAFSVLLIFQIIATKYTTYTFPSLFAFALLAARLWRGRLTAVLRAGAAMTAVYTALALVAAPLATLHFSGASVGTDLAQMDTGGAPVLFYDGYRTSAVFYSGLPIYRLTTEKEKEALQPDGISWNAKNVMPFFTEEELRAEPGPYLIVLEEKAKERFLRTHEGTARRIIDAGTYLIIDWEQA